MNNQVTANMRRKGREHRDPKKMKNKILFFLHLYLEELNFNLIMH